MDMSEWDEESEWWEPEMEPAEALAQDPVATPEQAAPPAESEEPTPNEGDGPSPESSMQPEQASDEQEPVPAPEERLPESPDETPAESVQEGDPDGSREPPLPEEAPEEPEPDVLLDPEAGGDANLQRDAEAWTAAGRDEYQPTPAESQQMAADGRTEMQDLIDDRISTMVGPGGFT